MWVYVWVCACVRACVCVCVRVCVCVCVGGETSGYVSVGMWGVGVVVVGGGMG